MVGAIQALHYYEHAYTAYDLLSKLAHNLVPSKFVLTNHRDITSPWHDGYTYLLTPLPYLSKGSRSFRHVLSLEPATCGKPHGHSVDVANDVVSGDSHIADP